MIAKLRCGTVQTRPVTGTEGVAGCQVGAVAALLCKKRQCNEKTEKEGLKLHARFQL